MSNGGKWFVGFIVFIVLYALVSVSGKKSTYHENDSQYLARIHSNSTQRSSYGSSRSRSSGYSGSSSRTSTTSNTKPYRSSSSSSSTKRTVDPMDHDIESYYLDYQDEFEDEDDVWDDFEDDPDVWDDY